MRIEEEYRRKLREIRTDVLRCREQFCQTWNIELSQTFGKNIDIEKYLEPEGGFWLSINEFNLMQPELVDFFKNRALYCDGRIFLRGYDYYSNDPTMHERNDKRRADQLLYELVKKWESYPSTLSFSNLSENKISFQDWVGYLSFFEYCFHDLTSIRWLEFKYGEYFEPSLGLHAAISETDELLDRIAEILALLLRHQYVGASEVASHYYPTFFSSPSIRGFLFSIPCDAFTGLKKDVPFIRSVQEGDSLFKIFAAYKTKLLPFVRKTSENHIVLYGNAFGAMSAGYVLKYLLKDENKLIECGVVNYSTHRYYIKIFKEVSSKAVFVSGELNRKDACSIIVDDTVWTAASYKKIVNDLGLNNTLLLPLSIDCNSLIHNMQLKCQINELYEIAQCSFKLAKEVGDSYPVSFSSWDRMRAVKKYNRQTDDIFYREILDGADLLMKHLWCLYYDKYISNEREGDQGGN